MDAMRQRPQRKWPCRTRRSLLRTIVGGCLTVAGSALGSCARTRYVDVLAPPSSLRPTILRLFERKTGIQVRPSAWVSPTDAFARVLSSASRTDLVVGTVDLFAPLLRDAVSRGLVLPLDQSKLPKATELSEVFRGDMCFVDDKMYMMPLYWGYTSVLYNREAISPSHWSMSCCQANTPAA